VQILVVSIPKAQIIEHLTLTSSNSNPAFIMSSTPLRAAILIVSTTAAKDPSADASESVLRNVFDSEEGKWQVVKTAIVPDVTTQIQRQLTSWSDGPEKVNLIVTTGGTGFAQGDDTPEVWQNQCANGAVYNKYRPILHLVALIELS